MKFADSVGREPAWAAWPWTLALLVLLLAWDAGGLDLALARTMADGNGFALRGSWTLDVLLHDWARRAAFATGAWLAVGIGWPTGILRRLPRPARIQWLASLLVGVAVVNLLKHASRSSCPWDLAEFGGTAAYLSHWAWGLPDGGPGHCFPAGHASAGFAFVGGFFALRPVSPRLALACLAAAAASGLVLGIAQQLRGAHFMSHTLWTAWLCWVAASMVDAAGRFLSQPARESLAPR
jgi:membrane-associated PAP2 superfamily phosphatase